MTRHSTIIAGRGARKRAVRVERKRREAVATQAARDPLRLLGTVIVADALGFADEALGGVMTGERLRGLLERPISSKRLTPEKPAEISVVGPISIPETASGFTPPGALADDVCRHVHQGWFGRALWLGGVL